MGLELLWLLGVLAAHGHSTCAHRRHPTARGSTHEQLQQLAQRLGLTPFGSGDGFVGQLCGYPLQIQLTPEGSARFRVRARGQGLSLRRRTWIDAVTPGIRTGDPRFDRWVHLGGLTPGARAALDRALRTRLRALVEHADLSLRAGTWRGESPIDRLSEVLDSVAAGIAALEAPHGEVVWRLATQARSDPARTMRLRAVRLLATRSEPESREALAQLVTEHPDWPGRWRAAVHLARVPALVQLALEAEQERSCWQLLRARHRQRALEVLLQTLPAPSATTELLRHLRGVAQLVRPGDALSEVIAIAPPEATTSQRVADALVRALAPTRTAQAARLVARLLPHVSDAAFPLAVALLQHDPHALAPAPLHALRSLRPRHAEAIEALLQAAARWRRASELARVLGLEVAAGRPLALIGRRQGLQLQIELSSVAAFRLVGLSPQISLGFDPHPPAHDPLAASWHHPAVRHALIVLRVIAKGGVKDGTIWFRSPPRAEPLGRGVDAALRLAEALHALPDSTRARLVLAIRDEPDAEIRLSLVQALLLHGWPDDPGLEAHLLDDPSPWIRIEVASHLRRLPLLAALAAAPELDDDVRLCALWGLRDEPGLITAALAAMATGLDPADRGYAGLLALIATRPTAGAQPLLLRGLHTPRSRLRRVVIRALAQIGTAEALPALRAIADHWTWPSLLADAQAAIAVIEGRLGRCRGALSVAGPGGELSGAE